MSSRRSSGRFRGCRYFPIAARTRRSYSITAIAFSAKFTSSPIASSIVCWPTRSWSSRLPMAGAICGLCWPDAYWTARAGLVEQRWRGYGSSFARRIPNRKMLPLSDTLVLDLTQVIAGPTAGQILGDMGADVIKVEPLGGEHFRPHFGGAWVPSMNRNKRGLAVDLRTAGGRDVLIRLVRKADVFMEAFVPGVIDKLGFGWETVSKENPRLVYASISGYGQTGPYSPRAGYDPCIQAEVGLIEATGPQDGEMCRVGTAPIDYCTGSFCAAGTRPAAANASTSRCSMSACT